MILLITLILALIFLPWPWSLPVIGAAALVELGLMTFGVRYGRLRRAVVGVQTLVGSTAEVITAIDPRGQVRVNGEIWEAHSEHAHRPGDTVTVRAVRGLTLEVD